MWAGFAKVAFVLALAKTSSTWIDSFGHLWFLVGSLLREEEVCIVSRGYFSSYLHSQPTAFSKR